ncbi:MAG: hypothetical protein ACKVWV_11505 [Planctomycetota bacterium]
MKKRSSKPKSDDMRAEYEFDYSKARPNRFAARSPRTAVTVVLDPDVAAVFRTSKAVNRVLRSMIATRPAKRRARTSKRKKSV